MRIEQIMTCSVVTVTMDDTLARVRELLAQHGFHHLPVTDKGRVAGLISDRDVLRHTSPYIGTLSERRQDASLLAKRAHQVMTHRVVSVTPESPVCRAAELVLEHGISCLPVVDERGRCLGIVTTRDLLTWALDALSGSDAGELDADQSEAA